MGRFELILTISFLFINASLGHARNGISSINVIRKKVDVNIDFHYSTTNILVDYYNPSSQSKDVYFEAVVPRKAFVTEFDICKNGKCLKSRVIEKKGAQNEYDENKDQDITGGEVLYSRIRNANGFSVPVNIEPKENVTVVLKYEEFLRMENNSYSWILNQFLTEVIPAFSFNLTIREYNKIEYVDTAILAGNNDDKKVFMYDILVDHKPDNVTVINFELTETKQEELFNEFKDINNSSSIGIKFEVTYGIESPSSEAQVLEDGNNFVYSLVADPSRTRLPIQIVFVLDTSKSMSGAKINQLKSAMDVIFQQLNANDAFQVIDCGTQVQVWNLDDATKSSVSDRPNINQSGLTNDVIRNLPKLYPASDKYLQTAKNITRNLEAKGATNIYDSIKSAFHLIKSSNSHSGVPIIMFLTDGEANAGHSNSNEILKMTMQQNNQRTKIQLNTLAFGLEPERDFLEKLALANFGSTAYIYSAPDAANRIKDFFEAHCAPVFQDVTFMFPDGGSDVTKKHFESLNKGRELVVAGNLPPDNQDYKSEFQINATSVNVEVFTPHVKKIRSKRELGEEDSSLAKTFAFIRIMDVIEEARKLGEKDVAREAVDLARKYGFVTPFTSLVVVKRAGDDPVEETYDPKTINPEIVKINNNKEVSKTAHDDVPENSVTTTTESTQQTPHRVKSTATSTRLCLEQNIILLNVLTYYLFI